jgi:hypothetical protein
MSARSARGEKPEDIVVAWPASIARATPVVRVRSTVLTSGMMALRARNLLDRYYELLPAVHRPTAEAIIAGNWLPIAFVMAHYDVCDRLELSYDDALAIGLNVGSRIHESLMLQVKRLASAAGVTPWTVLAQYDRFWQRTFDGGAFVVTRAGPKDAIIQVAKMPLARFPYFRAAYCGVTLAGARLFAKTAFVRPLSASVSDYGFAFRLAWA